ncbi:MAG: hypothetical protein H8E66_04565 [Planctomycetes bacterium]|nr:hypothetical protein [Planctomycetota bacterium]
MIHGGGGIDDLFGNGGNDELYIEYITFWNDSPLPPDAETASGGEGNDKLVGEAGGSGCSCQGGPGDDLIFAQGGRAVAGGQLGGWSANVVYGGPGDDTIFGSEDDDEINGGPDNDIIFAAGGMDEIEGESGNDTISGGSGVDTINGGDNDDWIDGGNGGDMIDGGTGNDEIAGMDGADVITDPDQPYNGIGGNPAFMDVKGTGDPADGDCDLENGHPDIECDGIEVTASIDPEPSNEAAAVTLSGTIDDPYSNGIYDIVIDWGDGATDTQDDVTVYSFTEGHTYADDGTYTVQVTVTDISDRDDAVSFTHIVNNLPPVPVITGGVGGPEGTAITLTGSATDPAAPYDTIISLDWSVTKGGTAYAAGSGPSFSFTPDDNGNYVVTLTAADEDGGSGSASTSLAVTNVAPSLTASLSTSVINEGSSVTISGTYTDPGSADTHTVAIDWDDGAFGGTPVVDTFAVSGGSFTRSYTYQDDGPGYHVDGMPGNGTLSDGYSIGITITDDDGGSDTDSQALTVNNVDPVVTLATSGDFEITLDVTIDDPGTDVPSYHIDWGDGFSESHPYLYFDNYQFNHDYMMEGTYTISVTVDDDDGGSGSASTTATVSLGGGGAFLTLADPGVGPQSPLAGAISMDAVKAMLPHAVEYWQESSGVTFQPVKIRIVDLPHGRLAAANPDSGTIFVDKDASGYGWFASEHRTAAAMAGRVDLLSALTHELGHVSGRHHDDHGPMGEYLALGTRSMPEADHRQHELTVLAVDRYFGAALPLASQRSTTLGSGLSDVELLPPTNDKLSDRKRLVAPLAREVVDVKLLDNGPPATVDSGGGADDELDLLLGGDAELQMDVETGELTRMLS